MSPPSSIGMLVLVDTARLGRYGPMLSMVGLAAPAPAAVVGRAADAGVNWVLHRSGADDGSVPPAALPEGWVLVVLGCPTVRAVDEVLRRYERDSVDVLVGVGCREWASAVAAADGGMARCVGVATDRPEVVEACRRRRHVDAVWASPEAVGGNGELTRLCRWGGTGVLTDLSVGTRGGWWTARAATASQLPGLLRRGGVA